jgi:hypothetical protein
MDQDETTRNGPEPRAEEHPIGARERRSEAAAGREVIRREAVDPLGSEQRYSGVAHPDTVPTVTPAGPQPLDVEDPTPMAPGPGRYQMP